MNDDVSCEEFHRIGGASRRSVLKGVLAAGAGITLSQTFGTAFRQTAFAATPTNDVLVVLSLRGGVDGLGLVVPHGDPAYYTSRPTLALPASSLICADPMFGLHPSMAPLSWLWQSGELAAIHAVGMEVPNRSHFAAMEVLEDADPGTTSRQGWVNRMVGLDASDSPLQAVQLGTSYRGTLISGPAPSLATPSVGDLQVSGLVGTSAWATRRRRQLELSWGPDAGLLGAAGMEAIRVSDLAGGIVATPASPVPYPTDAYGRDLGEALADSVRLIKSDIGAQVITIDHGTWDMHSAYGSLADGRMVDMVGGLARALNAVLNDLGDARSRVTVVTISEFGRRVAENGNGGLDHGWGNMMLLTGPGVRGGQYHGTWPGLGPENRVDGDLKVTTDYRNVFAEVITRLFPDRSVASVFPGLSYAAPGVMKPV